MLTQAEQERLCGEVFRASCEAIDMSDLGTMVLPLLDRLLDTSTSLAYCCDNDGRIVPVAGDLVDTTAFYAEHYFGIDPLQQVLQRANPLVLQGSRMPNWDEYLESAAHNECATRNGIDYFLHLRLSDSEMHAPGMVGIMVARTFSQPDFTERENRALARVLPALEAFARRKSRLDARQHAQPFLESIVEQSADPIVVLDLGGRVLWASDRATELLGTIPHELSAAARQLGLRLADARSFTPAPVVANVPRKASGPVHAELRLVRSRCAAPFIVAELEDPKGSPKVLEVAATYNLTKAETRVLQLLAIGLSNKEISAGLVISLPTVHTHVNHIFGKLGVGSRTQAALLAHGVHLPADRGS